MNDSLTKWIVPALKTGLIIGLLDGTAACVNAYLSSGLSSDRVFRYVASGAFGAVAFTGGSHLIFWGVLFHFVIAIGWTILFYGLANRFSFLQEHFIVSGTVYGIVIWCLMNFVVVPLSATPPVPFRLKGTLIMIGIHIVVIGIPMAYLTASSLKILQSSLNKKPAHF